MLQQFIQPFDRPIRHSCAFKYNVFNKDNCRQMQHVSVTAAALSVFCGFEHMIPCATTDAGIVWDLVNFSVGCVSIEK